MMRTVLLKGYYGFGNFGDDLLFIVSWRWLREKFPRATITVCTESPEAGYLAQLVGEKVDVVHNQDSVKADLIFHGGGGTYFDFRGGPSIFLLWNALTGLLGPRLFRGLYNAVQGWRGRTRIQGRQRVGIGIGIGTYTRTSRRRPFDVVELSEFDLLVVRDPRSFLNAEQLGIRPQAIASDLVFVTSKWIPPTLPARSPLKIGVVLRDWTYDNNAHHDAVAGAISTLAAKGHEIAFFSFDAGDKSYETRFASLGEWHPWIPGRMSLDEYVRSFSSCGVVIASRAHGVLVATCLGIPTVCLEIEPKLSAVAGMVPHSTIPVKGPFKPESVVDAILKLSSRDQSAEPHSRSDKEENTKKILAALDLVNELARNS